MSLQINTKLIWVITFILCWIKGSFLFQKLIHLRNLIQKLVFLQQRHCRKDFQFERGKGHQENQCLSPLGLIIAHLPLVFTRCWVRFEQISPFNWHFHNCTYILEASLTSGSKITRKVFRKYHICGKNTTFSQHVWLILHHLTCDRLAEKEQQ